ncbi:hypothetical protein VAWG005_06990 [Aeromonas dhakensis]|nr:hypothetical protein VAWG003_06950 [Aeromonas dhakensis]BEE24771.1 hypothetical protein VAWG005_06990 [Aeromonas dhakensis]
MAHPAPGGAANWPDGIPCQSGSLNRVIDVTQPALRGFSTGPLARFFFPCEKKAPPEGDA